MRTLDGRREGGGGARCRSAWPPTAASVWDPAATAQLLTDRFARLLAIGVGLSIVESILGLYVSFYGNWASGATIVLVQTAVFALVLAVSPRRGMLVGGPGSVAR